eukprot:95465-Prorocentrum_minimum.AAC.1
MSARMRALRSACSQSFILWSGTRHADSMWLAATLPGESAWGRIHRLRGRNHRLGGRIHRLGGRIHRLGGPDSQAQGGDSQAQGADSQAQAGA